jgi:hypothetical protein
MIFRFFFLILIIIHASKEKMSGSLASFPDIVKYML